MWGCPLMSWMAIGSSVESLALVVGMWMKIDETAQLPELGGVWKYQWNYQLKYLIFPPNSRRESS